MLREAHRRKFLFVFVMLAGCGVSLMSMPRAHAQTFLSFDAPGAGTAGGQGTFPMAINRSGLIVGYFVDGSNVQHGFTRAPDGAFTTVDFPGAFVTQVTAVNSKGLVAGVADLISTTVGFLLYRNGKFGTLDVPGASYVGPVAMNDIGQIAGEVALPILRGFVWSAAQRSTIISYRGYAGAYFSVGALNSTGEIAGDYSDRLDQKTVHAFLRDNLGNVTSFDAADTTKYTVATAINTSGQVTGWSIDVNEEQFPFLRDADGTITLFDVGDGQAQATSINDAGVVVGTAYTTTAVSAFERDAAGNITILTLPFSNLANTAIAVNESGRIVGSYFDQASVVHGWLMTP